MIRKNLFKTVMFATTMAGAMVVSSCSHDDYNYSEEKAQAKTQEINHAKALASYEKAFVKLVGQPASNQCWDFTKGGGFVATRSASTSDQLRAWPSYDDYTNGFNDTYATGNNSPLHEPDLNSVFKTDLDSIIARIETAEAKKQFSSWAPTGTYVFRTFATVRNFEAKKDKYYSIGGNFSGYNNYIALQGVNKNHPKRGTTGSQHASCIKFDKVPAGTVWYATATEKKKNNKSAFIANDNKLTNYIEITYNGNTFWGFKCEADGKYSDFILWVQKIEAPVVMLEYAKRFMVEDLGSGSDSDIDFNDIVFDVEQYTDGSQRCVVRALGGTLPITINVNGYSWSKPADMVASMKNTGADGAIDYNKELFAFEVKGWNHSDNSTISVNVKDKDGFSFITTFPENGSIPLMVVFSIAKHWNSERQPINAEWFTTYPYDDDDAGE